MGHVIAAAAAATTMAIATITTNFITRRTTAANHKGSVGRAVARVLKYDAGGRFGANALRCKQEQVGLADASHSANRKPET